MTTRRKTKKSISKMYEVIAVDMGGGYVTKRVKSSNEVKGVFSRLLKDNGTTLVAVESPNGKIDTYYRSWTTGRWSKRK